MKVQNKVLWSVVVASVVFLTPAGRAGAVATPSTWGFSGSTNGAMAVNNGTNTGTVPSGSRYTGSLSIDETQNPTPIAYGGGTHTVYTFTDLSFTIGGSTASSGPGVIDVYDNLTTTSGYPSGDSVYVNFTQGVTNTTGVAPSGLLAGAAFNWMGLALLDPSGQAITAGALPADFSSAGFSTIFSEFNYGTKGTAWGAGNTSQIQGLTSLIKTSTGTTSTTTTTTTSTTTTLPATTTSTVPATTSTTTSTVPATTSTTTSTVPATTSTTTSTTVPLPPVVCSGTNAIETAYAPRDPGFIVVNGGQNLLDHLWTTNLDATNTTFLGGLTNWYQNGLVLSYSGTADPSGCILDHLTVAPAPAPTSYTVKDESSGKITAIPADRSYLMVGSKKLVWNGSTRITVNTPKGERTVVDGYVAVGMKVQWKGLRDKATNTVLASKLEVN